MTVKELKKALRGIPDDTEVLGLTGGSYSGYVGVSSARLDEEVDEDGIEYKQLVIYLTDYLD